MARKLSARAQRWLKVVHLVFVALWVGGGVSLVLLGYLLDLAKGTALHGGLLSQKLIDDFIIIPGAMGCLLTGLLYSLTTRWGFFRFPWVAVKWVLAVAQILFGTFFLGPWLNGNVALVEAEGARALAIPLFSEHQRSNLIGGTAQVLLLLLMVALSVLKPWKRKKAKPSTA